MFVGTWEYRAGASGTEAIPAGATLGQIYAHSTVGGTVTIFGGATIPVVAGTAFRLTFYPMSAPQARAAGSGQIAFVGTDSYFVDYFKAGNT